MAKSWWDCCSVLFCFESKVKLGAEERTYERNTGKKEKIKWEDLGDTSTKIWGIHPSGEIWANSLAEEN